MKSPQSEASSSPDVHRKNIMRELSQLIEHLEADTRRVKEPRFRGLLDKSAEVLKSLRSLFERYESNERRARSDGSASAERSKKVESSGSSTARKASRQRPAANSAAPQGGGKAKSSRPRKEKMTTLTGEAAQKSATLGATPEPIVAAAKPVDPGALAALAQQQRKEARAPQTPGDNAAPKPLPPQSGKPVWSKPHSS
jgi:hypothetical protein